MNLLLIFIGGGLGAIARFGLSAAVQTVAENTRAERFPAGIFACNLLGCFLIGLLFGFVASRNGQHPGWLHPLAVTGFLGGFTTFSTFALDSYKLFSASPALALLNITASVVGSLAAVWLGMKLAW